MGDVSAAQWNVVQEVFGSDTDLRFLMCYFHVAKKVYEKTRSLTPRVAAFVMADIHDLHIAVSEMEFHGKLVEVEAKWPQWSQLTAFSAYFTKTYNAAIKQDVTLQRTLKVGELIDQVIKHCQSESVRARPFAVNPSSDTCLVRRAKATQHEGLLLE
ncbi:hypothetical protein BBJ28_00011308 [Nothophytophthora sp. Chile5]|nr:hypothetical protein BBJ28_00011308 [Nothophytophthora sp. Chile5]